MGPTPEFEIEHIIPISRCLDDSFANKTLCHAEENRRKHGKTPWEAYSRDQEKWEGILQRVKKFSGDMAEEKLNRFKMDAPDGKRGLYRIGTISKKQNSKIPNIEFTHIKDAFKRDELKKRKLWRYKSVASLSELNCRKVIITPLGEVRRAND